MRAPRHETYAVVCGLAAVIIALALCGGHAADGVVTRQLAVALWATIGFAAWLLPLLLLAISYAAAARRVLRLWPIAMLLLVCVVCACLHLLGLEGGWLGAGIGQLLLRLLGPAAYAVCAAALVLGLRWVTGLSPLLVLGWLVRSCRARLRRAWRVGTARELDEYAKALVGSSERVATQDSRGTSTKCATAAVVASRPSTDRGFEAVRSAAPARAVECSHKDARDDMPRASAARPAQGDFCFQVPSTSVLAPAVAGGTEVDELTLRAHLTERARVLEAKLAEFDVFGRVDGMRRGPLVTVYEFEPRNGTKVSKILPLAADLSMALRAKVRVVSALEGAARVGFEVANELESRELVCLRELLEDDRWRCAPGALPFALGKDTGGEPVYADLAQMPHLLVAGATGTGKSVGLNVLLCSLLLRKSPADLRLLLLDPKVVEFSAFDGIPHLLCPVITDTDQAASALDWTIEEMERRYQLFQSVGARNIHGYNSREEGALREGSQSSADADGRGGERKGLLLPSIVVVVDEFADLMMVASKSVEAAIKRLAQKARAAGIHLVLATQRPSVDVITGVIKANFPARLAFKVSQREDSKTILGRSGAEYLLGQGDMLCLLPGSHELQRVHGACVREEEVATLCGQLRKQGAPCYDDTILQRREEKPQRRRRADEDDALYDDVVAFVAMKGSCSTSLLQRTFNLGYNRAARLMARLEREEIVGPAAKAGALRAVLIDRS